MIAEPPIYRFRRNVERTDGCWHWRGYKTRDGYGHLYIGGTTKVYAHRYSFELVNGPIPEGMVLDHLCNNRGCVNPAHLEVVTLAENARRGRAGRPTRRGSATPATPMPDTEPTLF